MIYTVEFFFNFDFIIIIFVGPFIYLTFIMVVRCTGKKRCYLKYRRSYFTRINGTFSESVLTIAAQVSHV